MQILVTIGSGVFGGAGVEFPTFPLTYAVALKTLWHEPECDNCINVKKNFLTPFPTATQTLTTQ